LGITILSGDSFARTVSDNDLLVVEFSAVPGAPSALEVVAQRAPQACFARVDPAAEPAIAAMFGLSAGPALLIFRQAVVLYLESTEHSAERIEQLVRQVQALDMDAIRAAIEEEKRAEVALRMRRVCPTARRGSQGG
jgi:thioredoxin-like negative regulator of GroEL